MRTEFWMGYQSGLLFGELYDASALALYLQDVARLGYATEWERGAMFAYMCQGAA